MPCRGQAGGPVRVIEHVWHPVEQPSDWGLPKTTATLERNEANRWQVEIEGPFLMVYTCLYHPFMVPGEWFIGK